MCIRDSDDNSVESKVPTNRTSPRLIKNPTGASGGRTTADTLKRVKSLFDCAAAAASDERRAASSTKKRERLFDDEDSDDEDSSSDGLTKEIVPTAEIRGSPAGNTKRGGRGPMLRVPVEESSGSPATNTRGRKKRK